MRIYERYTSAEISSYGIDGSRLPRHVAIIMDGNGRWARSRFMPRAIGHRAGMEALHNIVRETHCMGIDVLTVYAFSTENWQRPAQEVNALFLLLIEYFNKEIDELDANNVRIVAIGDIAPFPDKVRIVMQEAIRRTRNNKGLTFCIAINYGSRAEIVRAVRSIVAEGIECGAITDETLSERMYTALLPDPDVIIRTAGEQRLSNFLLWQAAYSELVYTATLWPEFDRDMYLECLREYQRRTRRFGKVVE